MYVLIVCLVYFLFLFFSSISLIQVALYNSLVWFFSLVRGFRDSFSLFPLVRWILSLALKVLYQESKAKGLLESNWNQRQKVC